MQRLWPKKKCSYQNILRETQCIQIHLYQLILTFLLGLWGFIVDDKCISLEDMIELLTVKRIEDDNCARLFNINMHLMLCCCCSERYRKLVKLYDIIEAYQSTQYEKNDKCVLL